MSIVANKGNTRVLVNLLLSMLTLGSSTSVLYVSIWVDKYVGKFGIAKKVKTIESEAMIPENKKAHA